MRPSNRLQLVGVIVAIFGIALSPIILSQHSRADTATSPWLVNAPPVLEKLADLPNGVLPPYRINGNRDCYKRTVITRPKRKIPLQSEISHTGCVVDTAYGSVENGWLQRAGATIAGPVKNIYGQSAIVLPIPYSNIGITLEKGAVYGWYLGFYNNMDISLDSSAIYTGEVTHRITTPPSLLRDNSGKLIEVMPNTLSYSANGEWMIADIPNMSTVRINTVTRQILPFGDKNRYDTGLSPGLQTAVSADGRYAVVSSFTGQFLRLYDLDTCGTAPNQIITKVTCKLRDLRPFVQQNMPGFLGVSQLKFRGNYAFDMYVNAKPGSILQQSHQILRADGHKDLGYQYLALGDSFASGEGAYQYKALTDTNLNKCHLSLRSYPYLIASTLKYDQYESVACSGAKIQDIKHISDNYDLKYAQAKGKSSPSYSEEILSGFLPGYREQIKFLYANTPKIITLSAGGNDIGFGGIIRRCLDSDTCYSTYEDRRELLEEINQQTKPLTDLYAQLKTASDPNVKIYVLGYPQFADPEGNCANNVHLNRDELIFSQKLINHLNNVIQNASANAGVFYVDVENAFDGHKLCETNSWNVAMNGLTAGGDKVNIAFIHGPIGNESFHPNELGHQLFMKSVLEKTNDLTAPMPLPNPEPVAPEISNALPILQVPKTNRAIRITKNITGTNGGVVEFGKTWVYEYNPAVLMFKAGSKVKAWVHSSPTYLGETTVDSSGKVSLSMAFPQTIPPGYHTLHLLGQNSSDEDIDLYQVIFVEPSSAQGHCVVVPDSDKDVDQDNIDDACDPLINKAPVVVALATTVAPTSPIRNTILENKTETKISDTQASPQVLQIATNTATTNPPITTTASPTVSFTPQNPSPPQVAGSNTETSPPKSTSDVSSSSTPSNPILTQWPSALFVLTILSTIALIIKKPLN